MTLNQYLERALNFKTTYKEREELIKSINSYILAGIGDCTDKFIATLNYFNVEV